MTIYNKLNLWIACCVAVEAWYAQGTLYISLKGAWLVVQLVLGKDQGILYQVRLIIRGDVIGARAKSSKGLGMPGKGWDL